MEQRPLFLEVANRDYGLRVQICMLDQIWFSSGRGKFFRELETMPVGKNKGSIRAPTSLVLCKPKNYRSACIFFLVIRRND